MKNHMTAPIMPANSSIVKKVRPVTDSSPWYMPQARRCLRKAGRNAANVVLSDAAFHVGTPRPGGRCPQPLGGVAPHLAASARAIDSGDHIAGDSAGARSSGVTARDRIQRSRGEKI